LQNLTERDHLVDHDFSRTLVFKQKFDAWQMSQDVNWVHLKCV